MAKREREKVNAPQVDSLEVEIAFRSAIKYLSKHGTLQERESGLEIVAEDPSGIKIFVVCPLDKKELEMLTSVSGQTIESIGKGVLRHVSRVEVSWEQTSPDMSFEGDRALTLVKFDPSEMGTIPEDAWKLEELRRKGSQYSVTGQGTPESIVARLQLISALR